MAHAAPIRALLLASAAALSLSGCGAEDIASPGEGVIVLPAPTPAPTPTPTPTPTGVVAAASCPAIAGPNQLADLGTITGTQGTWRNCAFPARFTASTAIPKVAGTIYSLPGRVDVGTDQGAASTNVAVTLTIDPGVTIFGATGVSYLAVNRGNRIDAVGTAAQPIVFTGRGNVVGSADDQTSQLWGGVVLLGRAPITDCLAPGAAEGTVACERETEGTSGALYGGAQPADNSGRMSYVQIRYSGFILSADKELQGLTPSGVGSGTQLDHIQIHNSSDDGIEVFGGRVNMKYLVLTGNEDDNLDSDVGYKGNIQYVIAAQRAGGAVGDAMIEADSNGNEGAMPRQAVNLSNFTFIQRSTSGSDLASILIRGGADYNLMNGIVVSPNLPCVRINSSTTVAATNSAIDKLGPPKFNSVQMQCSSTPFLGSGGPTNADVQSLFTLGTNNSFAYTPSLVSLFINGTAETGIAAFNAKTANAFFDTTNYIGAVKDASDTWYAGWACNSATASFGTTSRACTAIPTT